MYKRLRSGPGWPLVVRTEPAAGKSSRDNRRTGLASFVQFTDMHLADTESPMRFEYLARFLDSAHRPHARVIEIADNHDGTLSLFTTLLESSARYATDFGDTSDAGLAALYRELSYNDIYASPAKLIGTAADHDTELLLAKPA